MKSKLVDTITSNEENVRLRIYEGLIPLDEADRELRHTEICQIKARNDALARRNSYLEGLVPKWFRVVGLLFFWRAAKSAA